MGALAFEYVLIFVQLCLLLWVAVFLIRFFIWGISGSMDAPFVPTPRRYAIELNRALMYSPHDVVYELGSGDGRLLLVCAMFQSEAKFIGIERNPILHVTALVRKRFSGNPSNVEFRWQNFFDADLRDATKIYAYLLDNTMARLEPKFQQGLRRARLRL